MPVLNPPVMTKNSRSDRLTLSFWPFGVAYQVLSSGSSAPSWQAVLLKLAMGGSWLIPELIFTWLVSAETG